MRFDYSNVPALQENQDQLFTRWRDLYKAGGIDLYTLQTKIGLPDVPANYKDHFAGQKPEGGSPQGALEAKAVWTESEHPRDKDGRFSSGGTHAPELQEQAENSPSALPEVDKVKALRDLHGVHTALGNLLPLLKPRWQGNLEVKPKSDLKAAGTKSWTCLISIAQEQFTSPARMICSMIHESVHSYSPTNATQMGLATNWEEGAVENTVRVHRQEIARQMGIDITEDDFRKRDETHPYRFFTRSLERLRGALNVTDERAFYNHLTALTAEQIEPYILTEATKLDATARENFDRVYAVEKKVLDGHWNPAKAAYTDKGLADKNKQNQETKSMNRDDVIRAILYARGHEAIAQARKIRDEWIRMHPDDEEIYEGSEALEMMAEAYELGIVEDTPPSSQIEAE